MAGALKQFNDEGLVRFREYLAEGAKGDAPLSLLENPETSEPMAVAVVPGTAKFDDRYQFGVYLNTLLKDFDAAVIANDQKFWSTLALVWLDRLCPPKGDGTRAVQKDYRYILSSDYRHYYRHLVRSPWQLVRQHGKNAKFLLVSPREEAEPLSVHGEILEQVGGRQQVLSSRRIIEAASRMYLDPITGRPRKGVAGSGRGSARRFGMVLRQLDLTYDPECMEDGTFLDVLPTEFQKWKSGKIADAPKELKPKKAEFAGLVQ